MLRPPCRFGRLWSFLWHRARAPKRVNFSTQVVLITGHCVTVIRKRMVVKETNRKKPDFHAPLSNLTNIGNILYSIPSWSKSQGVCMSIRSWSLWTRVHVCRLPAQSFVMICGCIIRRGLGTLCMVNGSIKTEKNLYDMSNCGMFSVAISQKTTTQSRMTTQPYIEPLW